jgi:hypothetical protein
VIASNAERLEEQLTIPLHILIGVTNAKRKIHTEWFWTHPIMPRT